MRILLTKPISSILPTLSYTFSTNWRPPSSSPSDPPIPYNINLQQSKQYLKKVQRSSAQLSENQKISLLPRRKRRIYDRERIDRNIDGYGAFRIFQQQDIIHKINQHCMPVVRKIMISPKWLVHGFGMGALPISNPRSSHRQYHFMDNQLNKYLLYEFRNTTSFKENLEDYDYQNQENIHPRQRITKRLSPQEFWKSQQKFQFRLNSTLYALEFKFQEWLLREIQKRKSMKSYDQYIDEKFGKVYTFNRKQERDMFQVLGPMVTQLTPQHFQSKTIQKKEKTEKVEKVEKKQKGDKKKKQKGEKAVQKSQKQEQKSEEKTQKVAEKQISKQQSEKKSTPQAPVATKLDEKYRIKPKMTIPQSQRSQNNQKAEVEKAK